MENANLPRREREKIRQRREMLAAALELFSEKGYHNVSMNEIAQRSEFAVGTLYKFFTSKDELYKTLMLDLADRFQSALREALETGDDEIEKLRNYVKVKGDVFKANLSAIRLFLSESIGEGFRFGTELDDDIREKKRKGLQALAAVIRGGITGGRFGSIADPFLLAVALDSITKSFLFLGIEAPERYPYPEDPDVILNILFKGMIDK